jgi:hypothetical protein
MTNPKILAFKAFELIRPVLRPVLTNVMKLMNNSKPFTNAKKLAYEAFEPLRPYTRPYLIGMMKVLNQNTLAQYDANVCNQRIQQYLRNPFLPMVFEKTNEFKRWRRQLEAQNMTLLQDQNARLLQAE